MNQRERIRALKQFEHVIRTDLNRWFMESDLNQEDLAKAVIRALDTWLDTEILGFEPDDLDEPI